MSNTDNMCGQTVRELMGIEGHYHDYFLVWHCCQEWLINRKRPNKAIYFRRNSTDPACSTQVHSNFKKERKLPKTLNDSEPVYLTSRKIRIVFALFIEQQLTDGEEERGGGYSRFTFHVESHWWNGITAELDFLSLVRGSKCSKMRGNPSFRTRFDAQNALIISETEKLRDLASS